MLQIYAIRAEGPALLEGAALGALPLQSGPLWLHLTAPDDEECRAVAATLKLPLEHLKAALDYNERPRLEHDDGLTLILARTSFQDDPVRNVPFSTCPVAAIISDEIVVTVCLKKGLVEKLLLRKAPGKGGNLTRRLVLSLLLRIAHGFLDNLQVLDEHLSGMEQRLKESQRNAELLQMLHIEKSLIYFLTALKGNQAVLEKLRAAPAFAKDNLQDLLDDATIETRQAADMAEIYSRILESVGDTFGAIVSNNLNKVMKVLTSLTVVLMVPSIIGALYGMNVALPGQDSPFAFVALSLLCLFFSLALFLLLRKKDWM